jgi:Fur family ferric uptake transcriptional regulator
MSGVYQTKQKKIIMEHLKARPDHSFSAKELHELCKACAASVGLATVYRQLAVLAEENRVKKIVTDAGRSVRFQYADAPADAFYLKCDRCGKVIPAHCSLLEQAKSHMRVEHGFEIDSARSLLYGRCSICK